MRVVREDLLVHNGGVGVERALAGDLLASIEDKSKQQTLANRAILPQCAVCAGNCFLLKFKRFSDHEDLVFNLLLGVTNATQAVAGLVKLVAVLDVPTRRLRDEEDLDDDDDRHQHLENNDHLPVPLAQSGGVLGAGVVYPISDKGADTVEHLPERHDLSANLRRCKLADVDGAGCECKTLTDTDEDTTADEAAEVTLGREGLDEGCDDDEECTAGHANSATSIICEWTAHEPTSKDGADGVGGVY